MLQSLLHTSDQTWQSQSIRLFPWKKKNWMLSSPSALTRVLLLGCSARACRVLRSNALLSQLQRTAGMASDNDNPAATGDTLRELVTACRKSSAVRRLLTGERKGKDFVYRTKKQEVKCISI